MQLCFIVLRQKEGTYIITALMDPVLNKTKPIRQVIKFLDLFKTQQQRAAKQVSGWRDPESERINKRHDLKQDFEE